MASGCFCHRRGLSIDSVNALDPTVVDSLTILADGDMVGTDVFVPMINPDNIDTSKKSLMVQEDRDGAQIWQHRFNQDSWRIVASVTDLDGESSDIVDASKWFGQGAWILDVQGHGANVAEDTTSIPGTLIKRESGQVLLMTIPASYPRADGQRDQGGRTWSGPLHITFELEATVGSSGRVVTLGPRRFDGDSGDRSFDAVRLTRRPATPAVCHWSITWEAWHRCDPMAFGGGQALKLTAAGTVCS